MHRLANHPAARSQAPRARPQPDRHGAVSGATTQKQAQKQAEMLAQSMRPARMKKQKAANRLPLESVRPAKRAAKRAEKTAPGGGHQARRAAHCTAGKGQQPGQGQGRARLTALKTW